MVGRIGRQFEYNRAALLQSVGAQAHKVVESYDRERESEQLAADMQSAVVATAGVAGVAAIGAIIALMTQIALIDVTGVTAAVLGGSIALFLLPAKKRQAKAAFNEKISALRDQLNRAMTNQFEIEMSRSVERVQEAIAPYTRFVAAENTKVRAAEAELARLDESFAALRRRIEDDKRRTTDDGR